MTELELEKKFLEEEEKLAQIREQADRAQKEGNDALFMELMDKQLSVIAEYSAI